MLLFSTRNFSELFLRDTSHEALQATENLMNALRIHELSLRPPDQRLDLD